MEASSLMIAGRVIERVIVSTGGVVALYFGYKLFSINTKEDSSAILSGAGFRFKADRIGAGIFFGLFGSIILIYSMYSNVYVENESTPEGSKQHSDDSKSIKGNKLDSASNRLVIYGLSPASSDDIPLSIKSVNTLMSIKNRYSGKDGGIQGIDYKMLMRAIDGLAPFQRMYIDEALGPGKYDYLTIMEKECLKNSDKCNSFTSDKSNAKDMSIFRDITGTVLVIERE